MMTSTPLGTLSMVALEEFMAVSTGGVSTLALY